MKPGTLIAIVAVAFIAVGFAIARTGDDGGTPLAATAVPHFRTSALQVRITAEPIVSRNQSPALAQLESGTIPDGVTQLTVLTDENCQADVEGVSHCLNRVTFETASGTGEAVLRHHHKMSEEPCFTPGQTLQLVA